MREIKFKVWDIQNKYWIDENLVSVSIGGYWQVYDVEGDQFHHARIGNEIEICQYTGLNDKNGVEIHDRDIAEWIESPLTKDPKQEKKEIGEITYNQDEGYWMWDRCWLCNCAWKGKLEIIGNRFENPELLEGKNDV